MVKTLLFHCRGCKFDPCWGINIPHAIKMPHPEQHLAINKYINKYIKKKKAGGMIEVFEPPTPMLVPQALQTLWLGLSCC